MEKVSSASLPFVVGDILEHLRFQCPTRITPMTSKGHFQISSDLKFDVVNCWRILVKSLDVECLLESLTIAVAHLIMGH